VSFGAVAWASVPLAGLGLLFVCTLALRRVALAREERRSLEAEERLRPLALRLLDGATPNRKLSHGDAERLAALLGRLARNLSGEARAHVAAFFEAHGFVARSLADLHRRQGWRRAQAAFLLGDMGSPQAVEPLIAALADDDHEVRAVAARSLGRLGDVAAVEPLVYALVQGRVPRAVAGQSLLSLGQSSLPRLRPLVHAPESEVRAVAVELIGLLGDAGEGPFLIDRICDSSAEVRAKTCRALGRLGASEAARELRTALVDRVPFVRATAAHALGALGDRSAAPSLLRQARYDSFDPAQAAARALAKVDPASLWAAARQSGGAGPHVAEAADLTAVNL
jgi:HEAT repeat protein